MLQVSVARYKIAVCIFVLLLLATAAKLFSAGQANVGGQVKKYSELPGFNKLFESANYEQSGNAGSMSERVAEYLGESNLIDPLDEKPKTSPEDPDFEEELKKLRKKPTPEQKLGEASKLPHTLTSSKEGANVAGENTLGEVEASEKNAHAEVPPIGNSETTGKSDLAQLKEDVKGEFSLPDAPFVVPPNQIVHLPAKEYPDVPAPKASNVKQKLAFRLYSHNVKNGAHEELVVGELPWSARKQGVINSIKLNAGPNTIVFLQEPVKMQVDDVLEGLNMFSAPDDPEWKYYGGGRIDGVLEGEHVPIILRPSEWDVVFHDTMWLNEQDTRVNTVGWDAKYPRIATVVTVQHKDSGNYLNLVNTHFDHKGKTARAESAKLLMEKMSSLNKWPLFLLGDLNALPNDNSHKQISKSYVDVHDLVPNYNRYGHPDYSVTGFLGKYLRDAKRIDYIFAPDYVKKLSEKTCEDQTHPFSLQIKGYGLLHSKFGGVYISDHRPLLADFVLAPCAV